MVSKWMWTLLVFATTLTSVCVAQLEDRRTLLVSPRVVSIDGPGVELTGKALQEIDTRQARVGDRVEFELVYDIVKKQDGQVAIPKGARITAVVTEAISRNDEQPESRLALRLERASWEHGSAALSGGIAAIMQVPSTVVKHDIERHPETSELPDLKNLAQGFQYFPMHPWTQREISPGQMPIGYEQGRDRGEITSLATDPRLVAMEDVSLRRGEKGVALVSIKKTVKIEKATYLLLRTETLQ
jgi:hypothetical protein